MYRKHLLDQQDSTIRLVKVSDGLSEMLTPHDAFLSDLTPEELINHKCSRLHNVVFYENPYYIFPSIKEFNQQYYSIESER